MIYDKDIREPLFEYLECTYGKVRILEEKRTGRSRADVVMITDGNLYGIEIKSDADSYTRLSRQIKDYDQYFDRNIVVVGSTHATHVNEHVPAYWGILSVEETAFGTLDFYVVREALDNPKVDVLRKLSLLWRPEMVHIQEKKQLPKYAQLSKTNLCYKLVEKIDQEELNHLISEELFERDYSAIQNTINQYRLEHGMRAKKKRKFKKRRSVKL